MPRDSSSMLALVGILVAVLVFIGTPAVSAVHLGYQNGSPVIGENNVNSMTIGVSNQSSSSPIYWRRPGCYRVGHTRTISIPGCVKFNISTNACRGYCMSYSIPSNEDIGPFEQLELEPETTTTALPSRAQLVATYPDGQLVVNYLDHRSRQRRSLAWLFSDNPQRKPPNNREEFLKVPDQMQASASTKTVHNLRGDSTSPAAASGGQKRTSERQLGKLTLDSSLVDAIMGSIADGKRRDVVSVSQCCNMMEAEEVLVNVRCGVNEVRQLVFKSAKTCECFFCKHV